MEQYGILAQRLASYQIFWRATGNLFPTIAFTILLTANGHEWRTSLVCALAIPNVRRTEADIE